MDKINFVNDSQPAINDTNLNLMQDNIENAMAGTKVSLSLINGWNNFGSNFSDAYCRKIEGKVFLGGMLRNYNPTQEIICILPEGFRPSNRVIETAMSSVNASQAARRIGINPDGSVHFSEFGTSTGDYVSLEGLSFDIE